MRSMREIKHLWRDRLSQVYNRGVHEMALINNPIFGEASEMVIEVIDRSKAMDPETCFIDFDKIWIDPAFRKDLISAIEKSIFSLPGSITPSNTVLVCPDNLRKPYGLIPAIGCVANNLDTYMAVWKEGADYITGLSKLYGPKDTSLDCIIFQDVVSSGGTILKMSSALKRTTWNIRAHIGLVRSSVNEDRIEANLKELSSIMDTSPLPIPFYYVTLLSRGS